MAFSDCKNKEGPIFGIDWKTAVGKTNVFLAEMGSRYRIEVIITWVKTD